MPRILPNLWGRSKRSWFQSWCAAMQSRHLSNICCRCVFLHSILNSNLSTVTGQRFESDSRMLLYPLRLQASQTSVRIHPCQQLNPWIQWLSKVMQWIDFDEIYILKWVEIFESFKMEDRKQDQSIKFWILATWFISFPMPPVTEGDSNTYNKPSQCFAR